MKQIISTLFFLVVFNSVLYAEIVSSIVITTPLVNYGNEINIQFYINKVTNCDSYIIETSIDYFVKKIVVNINYNYFSNCTESNIPYFESANKLVLLEGTYSVEVKVNVLNDFNLDETHYLTPINVIKSFNQSCDNSFIPYFYDICPTIINQVCACNGQNYDNECEAYFLNRNGLYSNTLCGEYIEQLSTQYECGKFQVSHENMFASYSCSDGYFDGKELYLKYEQLDESDTLKINFKSFNQSTRLFLTKLEFNNIVCIAQSNESKLEVVNLPVGTYYIIVDSNAFGIEEIEFCNTNSISNTNKNENLIIFPNPINSFIGIKSNTKINEVRIYNILGIEKYNKNFNEKEIMIDNKLNRGVYLIQVETNNEIQTKKIIIK